MDVVQTSVSIFSPPPIDNSITKEYWVEYNPVAAISENGIIEFNIPGTSMDYINLAKSKLHVTYVITGPNGEKINDERNLNGHPTANNDQVGPVNFTLHSIFQQIDLSLNQKIVSVDVGVNYPYKAMIDLLLQSSSDMLNSQAQAAFYFKDLPGYFDVATYLGGNTGFSERSRPTKDGEEAHIEGVLLSDFSNGQNRAILNGVSINFKFFQSTDPFRLLRNGIS